MKNSTRQLVENAARAATQPDQQGQLAQVPMGVIPPPTVMRQMIPHQLAVGVSNEGHRVLQFTQGTETWAVILTDPELRKGIIKGLTGGIELPT